MHFYQIQTKFRDERRPRFGVMRGREFVMKDGYSFHADYADLQREYRNMHDTYTRIFTRLGLNSARWRPTPAPSAAPARTNSTCSPTPARTRSRSARSPTTRPTSSSPRRSRRGTRAAPNEDLQKVADPGQDQMRGRGAASQASICRKPSRPWRVMHDDEFHLLLLRGDHDLNEIKAQKVIGGFPLRHRSRNPGRPEVQGRATSARSAREREGRGRPHGGAMSDFVCGANEEGFHLTGVNWGRDLPEPQVADIRNVVAGDPSPDGKGMLEIVRGIEVGHVFQLRTKYSEAMKAHVPRRRRASAKPFEMGCYGIGVTRIVAAAIEQNHDRSGIIFPAPIAPFEVVHRADRLPEERRRCARLPTSCTPSCRRAGVDVLLDDRDERPGRAVRRHGADRHPASRRARRARARRRQRRIQGPPRREGARTCRSRRSRPSCRSASPHDAGAGARPADAACAGVGGRPAVRAARRLGARPPFSRRVRQGACRRWRSAPRADAQRWLAAMDERLERRIPDRKPRLELLRTVHYEATRARLDPQLVLGVIEVESGFRKYAVSRAGARGYMQVMPFWVKLIGEPSHNLFHLRTNLAYGCAILRHYLDLEKGDYLPRARPLQRQPRQAGVSEPGARGVARPLEIRRSDGMINAAARAPPAARQLASRASRRPKRGTVVLGAPARVHRADAARLALRRSRSLILLIGSINYALSLGFALTFLLAGMGLAGMVHTARNLARIAISVGRAEPVFAGEPAQFRLYLDGARGIRPPGDPRAPLSARAAAGGRRPRRRRCAEVLLAVPARRAAAGCRSGRVMLETRFPLGIFRAWSYVEPDARCLVYPKPERSPLPAPTRRGGARRACARRCRATTTSPACAPTSCSDSPRHVAWKAVARSDDMLTKQFTGEAAARAVARLEPAARRGLGVEQRLSRLAGWVLAAERAGVNYGLRLPGVEIAAGRGEAHRAALPAGARAVRTGRMKPRPASARRRRCGRSALRDLVVADRRRSPSCSRRTRCARRGG